jgi:hypothetical protein
MERAAGSRRVTGSHHPACPLTAEASARYHPEFDLALLDYFQPVPADVLDVS